MILFILLTSYLFFIKKQIFNNVNLNTYNNPSNNINNVNLKKNNNNNANIDYVGFDNRYSNQSDLNLTTKSIIQYNLKKRYLLNILQDPNISLYAKLKIIDTTNDIILADISVNKLMDDFFRE
jgi:hypothetical protein